MAQPEAIDSFDAAIMANHFGIGFHLGAGGRIQVAGLKDDLIATLGIHARLDIPIHRYVALAPMITAAAWQSDSANSAGAKRNFYVDLNLMPRGRYPIDLPRGHLDVYAGIPVGGSIYLPHPDNSGKVRGGWNIGWVLGGRYHFASGFGVLVELGWLRHAQRTSSGGRTINTVLRQTLINVGVLF
ncbi:MAG: hypothetical protein AAGE52_00645 [Myxococcota bacterium]